MNPRSPLTSVSHHADATISTTGDPASAALSKPPPTSCERDRQLLHAAVEAGVSGQALSVLERIDIGGLDAHDRVTYLQVLTAHAAWLEASHAIAVAAVAGPSGGWVEAEIEDTVSRDVEELSPRHSTAREREHLAAQARDEAWEVRERAIALEVSMAMRVSPRTAGRRISGARLLLEQLRPAVDEALAGHWGYGHLRVVEKELGDIPEPLRREVFGDVLPHAATDHPRKLTDRIRKSLARRDAAGSAERMRERAQSRDVALWNLPDGQARLVITGPYQSVTTIHRILNDLAVARREVVKAAARAGEVVEGAITRETFSDTHGGSGAATTETSPVNRDGNGPATAETSSDGHGGITDLAAATAHANAHSPGVDPAQVERRLGVLRFDVLEEAAFRMRDDMDGVGTRVVHNRSGLPSGNVAGSDSNPHATTNPRSDSTGDEPSAATRVDPWIGPRVHAPGSRPEPQAAVIVDLATALGMADEPGFLPGYGWIPAPIAREILATTDKWRRWLVDDSSRKLIEAGSVRYRPSQALRDLITGRDLTCTADTCTRPASNSQLDHAIDFDGSNTTPGNMHAVCGPDHLVVTAGHFLIDTDDTGRISWVSTATGHTYPSHPDLLHEQPLGRADA
ncbi:MAG: hypothetical protein B7C55_00880 [Actinomycetales bacterium mxb001]|nr:MAG: hypothetical protein B7C55_00880 [Actinomycetales bacterium mxb001]